MAHTPKNIPYHQSSTSRALKSQQEATANPQDMLDHMMEYSHSAEVAEAEAYSSTNLSGGLRKRKIKNQRRFSDKQIKSLESMFETESRLEPRKKLQLARELGLQPRQVAIWFQNKRARWKSKQIERDYSILRANYSSLASRFEALKKEKQTLLIQVLTDLQYDFNLWLNYHVSCHSFTQFLIKFIIRSPIVLYISSLVLAI